MTGYNHTAGMSNNAVAAYAAGGTWYNRVDFFDPDHLADLIRDGGIDLAALRTEWRGAGTSGDVRVRGIYSEFGGSRRRPQHLGDVKFTGLLRGDWIHLDGGGRKRADGRHITWTRTA